ncbi:hypothetical protein H4R35_003731 [Dimargaris xerosporica]|nr:hypothetical protein H4R35_003731 [Dimargaris xerosporica]
MSPTPVTKRRLDEVTAALSPVPLKRSANDRSVDLDTEVRELVFRSTPVPNSWLKAYKPWDRTLLLARIATFRIVTWREKAHQLSPAACGLSGWYNASKNTLACGFCQARLLLKPAAEFSDADRSNAIKAYQEQLTTAHKEACPWRNRCCDPALFSLPLRSGPEVVTDFVDSLKQSPPELDPLAYPQLTHPLSKADRATLLTLLPKATPSPIQWTHAILRLFGWHWTRYLQRPTLYCPMCQRKTGAWLFQTLDADAQLHDLSAQSSPAAPSDGPPPDQPDAAPATASLPGDSATAPASQLPSRPLFDVCLEHRSFCYWVTPDPRLTTDEPKTHSDTTIPWRRSLQLLLDHATGTDRPNHSHLAHDAVSILEPVKLV